ncbi:ATP-binding cassette domain-containing protein [Paenibacillus sp. TAF43_2]|uniref:ATP-binding cassette domain-containing protein n=1 Tax=Paenibacillus sp. TAF43_2 TaxID=3233069 RepID=UPI003F976DD4
MRRTKMVFVFQQPTMLKNLNILDNVILPSMRDNRKNAEKISEKARVLMKRVGIAELEKRDVTQVSGGQLQRAGIFCFKINDLTGLKYTNDSTRSVMLAEFILRGR